MAAITHQASRIYRSDSAFTAGVLFAVGLVGAIVGLLNPLIAA